MCITILFAATPDPSLAFVHLQRRAALTSAFVCIVNATYLFQHYAYWCTISETFMEQPYRTTNM